MNLHVVIGTEKPSKHLYTERPQTGESILMPDGRTVIINQLIHDLAASKLIAKCSAQPQGMKKK